MRPQWYLQPGFIRKKRNHSWTKSELKRVYTLRLQKVPVPRIINEMHLKDIKKTQIYNVLRMMKKNFHHKCFQCGGEMSPAEMEEQKNRNFKICAQCQSKNTNYKQKLRKKLHKQGLCTCCGKNPSMKNKKTCPLCLSYTHRNRISMGICGSCGKHPLSKHSEVFCDKCLSRNRMSQRSEYANS